MSSVWFTSELEMRFWAKVYMEPMSGCWLWGASCDDRSGYGYFRVGPNMRRAHVVSWQLHNGVWELEGLVVRHTCDNPPCVNPDHLLLGTQKQNVHDRDSRGRRNVQGSRHPRSKLVEADILDIRGSSLGKNSLASEYGVSLCTINDIQKGRTWQHVPIVNTVQ